MGNDVAFASDDALTNSEVYPPSSRSTTRRSTETLTESEPDTGAEDVRITVGTEAISFLDVPVALVPRLRNVAARLNEIGRLPTNWDSYEAPSISNRSLERAAALAGEALIRFDVEPFIAPASCGGVILNWETPADEIELEICDDRASLLFPAVDEDHREADDLPMTKAKMLLFGWLQT